MKPINFRSIAAAAASSFVFALAACGGGGGGSAGDTAAPTVEKPAITAPPASQSVEAGKTATFTVTATGGETLAYQWKKNGVDIPSATASTYTTPAASSADNGAKYSVAVSNSAGTATSSDATLTVTSPVVVTKPAITMQPAAQTVVLGSTAIFSVSASGTAPFSYQWKKNGVNIPNATSSSYTTPDTSMANNGDLFSVVVSNSAGSVTSNEAKLGVSATAVKPAIATQPAHQSVITGETATFTVTASGTAPFTYQWKKNGANIPSATSDSYTTPATSIADSGLAYSVVVTNSAGTVTSKDATLTVTATAEKPAITTQPEAQTVTEGQTATFSVTATGTSPGYQWKKNGTDIEGVTTSSHTTDATAIGDSGAVFTVVVTNSVGSVTSSGATLTVNAAAVAPVAPTITAQPTAREVDPGNTATFSVTATGTAPLSYQWKKNGTDISGATSNTYNTPATTNADIGAVLAYSVVVTNSAGSVTSSNATLTVNKYSLVANASGGFYDRTECVKDNSTELIWEGKTASGDRAGSNTYTNYDSTTGLQSPVGTDVTQANIDATTNSIGYRNTKVNTGNGLCGFTDWRMPTKDELLGIVDLTSTSTQCLLAPGRSCKINTTWFPNTNSYLYWSSTPQSSSTSSAEVVNFSTGTVIFGGTTRNVPQSVRLVRCAPGATCTSN